MPGPSRTFVADLGADLTPADRVLCVDGGIALGTFRAAPSDAVFAGSERLRCYYLVFPRTASEIRLERGPAAVHTPVNIVAYNAGDSYRRVAVSARGDASDYIAVDKAIMRRFLLDEFGELPATAGEDLLFSRFNAVQTRALFLRQRGLFDRLIARASADLVPPEALHVREQIADILLSAVATGLVGRSPPPMPPALRQQAIAEDIKRHMCRHFCERLKLERLAMLAGVSTGHLARIFRRQAGLSIHQFLTELRLRESLELLLEMRSITEVALHLGFTHHSHFTAAFGRAFGTTPSAYMLAAPRQSARCALANGLAPGGVARSRSTTTPRRMSGI